MLTSSPLDVDRLLAESCLKSIERYASISSTQDRAHAAAKSLSAEDLPLLIVADQQTAGRGRGRNRWWTGAGSLAFSLLFDPAMWDLPPRPYPERSLCAAVAVVDAVQPWLAEVPLGIHWPNDVFAAGRKLAGILIDVLPDGRHILGLGLNTNNSLADAPADVRGRATSIFELTGRPCDHTAVLLTLLQQLSTAMRLSAGEPERIGRRFAQLCLQAGRELTIEVGPQRTTGRCQGIAPDGALLLETPAGLQKFYSGVLR